MLAKRIIPCLDIKNGRVVKGVNFINIRDAGDPVDAAKAYNAAGADELVFLDIAATLEERDIVIDMVREVAGQVFIPFTVGGGIRNLEDIRAILQAGADKISLNSAAVRDPGLVKAAAERFGSQCVVVAIDVRKNTAGRFDVLIAGGTKETGLDALQWAREVESLGAGEILLTSMDKDGTKAGYDLEITRQIADAVKIPVIASGGAGSLADFYDACTQGGADAVLAASLFHFGEINITDLKRYLAMRGLPVRPLPGGEEEFSAWEKPFLLTDEPAAVSIWQSLRQDDRGLVPVIAQDEQTGAVLMQAWQNGEAWLQTLATGLMHYYSRSRGRLWLKGETSGNFQQVREIFVDCDSDCLLFRIRQAGPACHTGNKSCFYRSLEQTVREGAARTSTGKMRDQL